ncbi:carbamoyltransferase [Streptomyces sp. NBC_00247]|uniref:carbamoyltransferase family protein n=1 Tax=Streptomyces sp. NBC_00247 TaxID=2975689 RepID=UPI002E2817B1|nr:carbamoyltransferase C-terminal domain-containing protein [Streptomyces sp. NBC_00247]
MITLGITGSFADLSGSFMPDVPEWLFHDSTAAVVVDGVVVAAVEEERLNRIKHSNKFPAQAARACLDLAGIKPSEVQEVAFFFGEDYADLELRYEYLKFPGVPALSARELLRTRLAEALGRDFEDSEIAFVRHHVAHAFGAYSDSGFDDSLAVVIDGNGEAESVSVFSGSKGELELLRSYPAADSLGHLYLSLLPLMGFRRFDEYKVMGLAPYGDAAVYRDEMRKFYTLSDDGDFSMDSKGVLEHLMATGFSPRRRGEKIRQQDSDLAAALQGALEDVELHLLRHWAKETGARSLCLSGGVAHNSSANGRVLQSEIFQNVFVHPASHDAGASAGAAQFRQAQLTGSRKGGRLRNVFLGPDLGDRAAVADEVRRWQPFLTAEDLPEGTEAKTAADAIAAGQVIGWAHGRSEFGPRALGHRSILADPRLAENRDRVNAMIKKREGFRPFAPAVLAEDAAEVFDLTATDASLESMSYVVDVRPEWRERLPAVTHVDGTARVQTVFQERNPVMWDIISEFRDRTGTPVVLNTSFNNFAEPIVQSVRDVVRCLLTTTLDAAVLPGHLIKRRADMTDALLNSAVSFHPAAELRGTHRAQGARPSVELVATYQYAGARSLPVSEEMFDFLTSVAASPRSLASSGVSAEADGGGALAEELLSLWEHRVIELQPPADR